MKNLKTDKNQNNLRAKVMLPLWIVVLASFVVSCFVPLNEAGAKFIKAVCIIDLFALPAIYILLSETKSKDTVSEEYLEGMDAPILSVITDGTYATCNDMDYKTLEEYKVLNANILIDTPAFSASTEKSGKLVGICPVNTRDADTETLAINLAYTESLVGKMVLLVDANMRDSSLSEKLELNSIPGFSDYLAKGEELNLQKTKYSNMYYVAAGTAVSNEPELLSSDAFFKIAKEFREHFDLIVMFLPGMLDYADTASAIPYLDGVVLAAIDESTPKTSFDTAVKRLGRAKNLLGFVLAEKSIKKKTAPKKEETALEEIILPVVEEQAVETEAIQEESKQETKIQQTELIPSVLETEVAPPKETPKEPEEELFIENFSVEDLFDDEPIKVVPLAEREKVQDNPAPRAKTTEPTAKKQGLLRNTIIDDRTTFHRILEDKDTWITPGPKLTGQEKYEAKHFKPEPEEKLGDWADRALGLVPDEPKAQEPKQESAPGVQRKYGAPFQKVDSIIDQYKRQ